MKQRKAPVAAAVLVVGFSWSGWIMAQRLEPPVTAKLPATDTTMV